jgi:hypothetical protein
MYKIFLLLLISFIYTTQANAHGGGLDSNDCHRKHSDNTYHCHPQKKLTKRAPTLDDYKRWLNQSEFGDADIICVITNTTIDGVLDPGRYIGWAYGDKELYIKGFPWAMFFKNGKVSYSTKGNWIASKGRYVLKNKKNTKIVEYYNNNVLITYKGTFGTNKFNGICREKG